MTVLAVGRTFPMGPEHSTGRIFGQTFSEQTLQANQIFSSKSKILIESEFALFNYF
jgi:hypothetical protein